MSPPQPKLGFLGVGWIGRNRMMAIRQAGKCAIVAVADASDDAAQTAAADAGAAVVDAAVLLTNELGLDGIVIATPSALHAAQAMTALDHDLAVFCQKPLARSAAECSAVVEAARRADRRLGVDFSYRHAAAAQRIGTEIRSGAIGEVYLADLVFHNAYGPDKAWFRDRRLSGGGCLIDLGIHLVDLALWTLGWPKVQATSARLFASGHQYRWSETTVEDHAIGTISLVGGGVITLACSWNLHAGTDAIIGATFYGTRGAVSLRNVAGSFYDFAAERYNGTSRTVLSEPPDAWGGRAAAAWADALCQSKSFDPVAEEYVEVAAVIDGMYGL